MNNVSSLKLGYVAYSRIIEEIQKIVERFINLSDEDYVSEQKQLLDTEGILIHRFTSLNLVSVKLYDDSRFVSLIETMCNLESYEEKDPLKFWNSATEEFQNYIGKNECGLSISRVTSDTNYSIDINYLTENTEILKSNIVLEDYLESEKKNGLILTFSYLDHLMTLALHDYHWIFDKWDSASDEDKEKSLNSPITSKLHPCFYIHYPQISNAVEEKNFVTVKFEFFDPVITIPQSFHTSKQDIDVIYKSRLVFSRVKAFFDKNVAVYDDKKEITDSIREKYVGVFRSFGKNLLFLTKHYKIDYEARSYAEMIFTC